MGNEQSQLPGIDIDEKAIEVSDFWSQHSASIIAAGNLTNLSIFIGEIFVNGSLWTSQTPLEKCTKNLMVFRHPCIIKYISSWKNNSKFYLAVEEVIPLAQVLPKLNSLQISVGLHSVLKALHFLHENASASHNNVCISSIYTTKDGNWKLGGMEYLSRYKDISCDYLSKTRSNRYGRSVDPNEEKLLDNKLGRRDFIDIYAFGALVSEILKSRLKDDSPVLSTFRDYCKHELQNADISKRPSFENILAHEFFNQDFITIHSFLVELPLKNDEQKSEFFDSLVDKLRLFDEEIVASQLSGLLLSRLVLLNRNAQERVLPVLLTPKTDANDETQADLIFSEDSFKIHLRPKLLEIFRVRDAQIRLLLLQHFSKFMHIFTRDELLSNILPELLVGIKDTDDRLVAVTLRSLADLVAVLGAAAVVGGKRAKLFTDGRPVSAPRRGTTTRRASAVVEAVAGGGGSGGGEVAAVERRSGLESGNRGVDELPERPRPDGEEGETSTEEIEMSLGDENDIDNWEDWDMNEANQTAAHHHHHRPIPNGDTRESPPLPDSTRTVADPARKPPMPEIEALDIKHRVDVTKKEEFDFFQVVLQPLKSSLEK
ncbi:unnamed protein product, partial [Phaedon cochleariae]